MAGLFLEHPETRICFSYQERILCHPPSNLDSRRAWLTEYDRSGTVIVPVQDLNKLTAFTSCLLGHLLFKPHHCPVRRPTPCCGETQARGTSSFAGHMSKPSWRRVPAEPVGDAWSRDEASLQSPDHIAHSPAK